MAIFRYWIHRRILRHGRASSSMNNTGFSIRCRCGKKFTWEYR